MTSACTSQEMHWCPDPDMSISIGVVYTPGARSRGRPSSAGCSARAHEGRSSWRTPARRPCACGGTRPRGRGRGSGDAWGRRPAPGGAAAPPKTYHGSSFPVRNRMILRWYTTEIYRYRSMYFQVKEMVTDRIGKHLITHGEDEEVVVHPRDPPEVGDQEHLVHDPHHL